MPKPSSMRTIALLMVMLCPMVAAETRTEAELRKQLVAIQAALDEVRAQSKTTQKGNASLTEAVKTQLETSKVNTTKLEEVGGKVDAAESSLKQQVAANDENTKRLTKTVETQGAHVAAAIATQVETQKKSLADAREVARKLEISNGELAAKNAEILRLLAEGNERAEKLEKIIVEEHQKSAIRDAKDEVAITNARYQMLGNMATPAFASLATIMGGVFLLIQVKQGVRQRETKGIVSSIAEVQQEIRTNVNGKMTEALAQIEAQRAEIEQLKAGIPPKKRRVEK